MTLRTRLAVLVLLATLPLLVLSLLGAVLMAREALTQATESLKFSAQVVAADQQEVADSARQLLTTISNLPEIVEGKEPACQRIFQSLTRDMPSFSTFGIIGTDGYLRCNSAANNPKPFAGDRAYFLSAMASGDFLVDGYMIGRLSNKPIITFALPLKGSDGNIKAVAFAAMLVSEATKSL